MHNTQNQRLLLGHQIDQLYCKQSFYAYSFQSASRFMWREASWDPCHELQFSRINGQIFGKMFYDMCYQSERNYLGSLFRLF
jgi:hypothetical protein